MTNIEFSLQIRNKTLEDLEIECEEFFLDLFDKLNIQSSVKFNRKSLPYNNEIIIKLRGESDMNRPFDYRRLSQKIIKELFDKDVRKLRFYFDITFANEPVSKRLIENIVNSFGAIEYKFRYYI